MFKEKESEQFKTLYSVSLGEAISDFYMSRKAMLCSPATLDFYKFTAGYFADWLGSKDVTSPQEVSARHVRAYLGELSARGLKDNTIHCHARAIKTFMRFCLEGYPICWRDCVFSIC